MDLFKVSDSLVKDNGNETLQGTSAIDSFFMTSSNLAHHEEQSGLQDTTEIKSDLIHPPPRKETDFMCSLQTDYDHPSLTADTLRQENNIFGAGIIPSSSVVPIIQKRGPGRPRKDGSGPFQRKKPPSTSGRPRGRRKHYLHNPHSALDRSYPSAILGASNLLYGSPSSIKIGEPAVALPSALAEGKLDKTDLGDLAFDSDASLSSAISVERLTAEDIPEHWLGKTCSLCNLGERSLLGQGELTRFEPTAGFNPFNKKLPKSRRNSTESDQGSQPDRSPKVIVWRRQRGSGKCGKSRKLPGLGTDEDIKPPSPPIDELSLIGFAEEPEPSQLFEPSGHVYTHHCCAAWSDDVCQTEDFILVNVDKAVVTGMSQKCSHCHRYGASVICKVPKCNKVYHFPCAASAGTFQDIKSMTLLCPEHLCEASAAAQIEANCIVCEGPGKITELIFCTSCGHHYHGSCLDPIVSINPAVRAGWQCPDCKICQTCRCRQPGDDNKMLMCDTCDKGYHTFCLKPAMTTIPKHGWKCKNCRVCTDCGAHTPGSGPSSRWHRNYTVCDSCYQQRNKGLACPMCGRAYRHFTQKDMVQCTVCRKYIHGKCDPVIDLATIQQQREAELDPEYVCPLCNPDKLKNLLPLNKDESMFTESPVVTTGSSQDLTLSANEDSICSMDIDLQAIERSTHQLQQLSGNAQFGLLDDYPHLGGKPLGISSKPFVSMGKFVGRKRIGVGRPRGSTKFVGIRRRVKAAEFGKRRGPKPKLKPTHMLGNTISYQPGMNVESIQNKTDDEPGIENKLVLCSAKDEYVLSQDLCVMCGSYGLGEEGRLIACSQCGQCYHPYCVSIKVTKVVLSKGWRCLDCTVCEGCGQPHDEGRLLLCDDCDISYHIYCLDPPLEQVPQGNWKCKWCVVCVQCGSTSPGYGSQWQNNYTQCGPCASQITCPVCHIDYQEDDLIIQCIQCDRWLHATCDQVNSEEDAEKAADYGYHCILCRPKDQLPPHLIPPIPQPKPVEIPRPSTPPHKSVPVKKVKESKGHTIREPSDQQMTSLSTSKTEPPPKPQTNFFLDGVCLSESGMHQIKSLTIEQPKKTRMRKSKLQTTLLKQGDIKQDCASAEDEDPKITVPDVLMEPSIECEKLDITDEEQMKDGSKTDEIPGEKKKRQRNLQKLGVGGFIARSRIRATFSKEFEKIPDNLEVKYPPQEIMVGSAGDPISMNVLCNDPIGTPDKPKRRRRMKKKSHLEDSYPAYLQEAFFGKDLLHTCKEQDTNLEAMSDDEISSANNSFSQDKTVTMQNENKVKETESDEPLDNTKDSSVKINDEEDLGDSDALKDILPLPQDLPQDDDLVDMLMNERDELAKTDEDTNLEDIRDNQTSNLSEPPVQKEDPLSDILGPHFNLDTMVTDTGLPQMDSKEVEDLIKGVFPEEPQIENSVSDTPSFGVGGTPLPPQRVVSASNITPSLQRPVQPPVQSLPISSSPYNVPPSTPYPTDYNSPQFSPGFSEPRSPWMSQEGELESPSHTQRSILKWESDEALGSQATISAVLYANINHPELKKDYPSWPERTKQIAKIWRSLPPETRQPYLQKARENRAASRVQKAQQMKDNKQQAKSPKPPPQSDATQISPRCTPLPEKEHDKMMRDQRSQRELEQERQWKHLQAMRQHQAQQQQQVLQDQRSQGPVSENAGQSNDGRITPATPEPFPRTSPAHHALASRSPVAEPFLRNSANQVAIMSDAVGQPRPALPGQLHVSTSQGPTFPPQVSPQTQSPGTRLPTAFPSPIQVSRVRPPPLDPMQMQTVSRVPNESFAQIQAPVRPIQDAFMNATGAARPVSPQIQRRCQDTFTRPPFAPRATNLVPDAYSPQTPTPKTPTGDPYSQVPLTPRPSEPYHTPPPSHSSSSEPYSRPSTPRLQDHFNQTAPVPRPSSSPFSPSHSPRTLSDSYPKSTSRSTPNQEPFVQSSLGGKQIPQDHYGPLPPTPRTNQTTETSIQTSCVAQENFGARMRRSADSFPLTPPQSVESAGNANENFQPSVPTRPASVGDNFVQSSGINLPLSSIGEQVPSNQDPHSLLTRQHLRDLLQRQQQKKMQEQQGQIPLRHWPPVSPGQEMAENNLQLVLQQSQQPHQQNLMNQDLMRPPLQPGLRQGIPLGPSRNPALETEFRQPYPPSLRPRVLSPGKVMPVQNLGTVQNRQPAINSPPSPQQLMPRSLSSNIANKQLSPSSPVPFRHPHLLDPRLQGLGNADHRLRLNLMQQRILQPNQLRPGLRFSDVLRARAAVLPPTDSAVNTDLIPPSMGPSQPAEVHPSSLPVVELGEAVVAASEGVTEDLEKLNVVSSVVSSETDIPKEGEPEPDEELDDDELLGLGNDFNILEYADPELDKDAVAAGNKTNILDENLDLDDKDEDLEEEEDKSKRDSNVKENELKPPFVETPSETLTETQKEDLNKKTNDALGLTHSDFQSKFLEFSQRRDIEKAEELHGTDIFEDESLDSNISSNKVEDSDSAKQNSNVRLERDIVGRVMPQGSQSAPVVSNFIPGSASTLTRSPSLPSNFPVADSVNKIPPQPNVPSQRELTGQFGQPPVSLTQNVGPIPSQPPPYPTAAVPPPPPYQGVIRPQSSPSSFPPQPALESPNPLITSNNVLNSRGLRVQQQRPPLVQEQPHLLEDLLEQEKEEQRRQQQQSLIPQTNEDNLLSDIDFEKLKADVLATAGPSVSLSPSPAVPPQALLPNASLAGHNLNAAMSSNLRMGIPRQDWHGHESIHPLNFPQGGPVRPRLPAHQASLLSLMQGIQRPPLQDSTIHSVLVSNQRPTFQLAPPPPTPPIDPNTEQERQQQIQYEQWLMHTKHTLESQQKILETDVGKLRKAKKSLNTRQRQMRKNGQELKENDALELERITQEQSILQKQLEQVRKQSKQHSIKIQDYQMKQQKRQQSSMNNSNQQQMIHPGLMSTQHSPLGPVPSPMMTGPATPQSPMLSPSPLGPSPSPLMQHSPSPMMQQSPLGPSPSPLTQHSPHGQIIMPQHSPRMGTPQPEQGVVRSGGVHVMQEDNNPFSDGFQQRELRPQPQQTRPLQHAMLPQGERPDMEGIHNSGKPLSFCREEASLGQLRTGRPIFGPEHPSQPGVDNILGPRMTHRLSPRNSASAPAPVKYPVEPPLVQHRSSSCDLPLKHTSDEDALVHNIETSTHDTLCGEETGMLAEYTRGPNSPRIPKPSASDLQSMTEKKFTSEHSSVIEGSYPKTNTNEKYFSPAVEMPCRIKNEKEAYITDKSSLHKEVNNCDNDHSLGEEKKEDQNSLSFDDDDDDDDEDDHDVKDTKFLCNPQMSFKKEESNANNIDRNPGMPSESENGNVDSTKKNPTLDKSSNKIDTIEEKYNHSNESQDMIRAEDNHKSNETSNDKRCTPENATNQAATASEENTPRNIIKSEVPCSAENSREENEHCCLRNKESPPTTFPYSTAGNSITVSTFKNTMHSINEQTVVKTEMNSVSCAGDPIKTTVKIEDSILQIENCLRRNSPGETLPSVTEIQSSNNNNKLDIASSINHKLDEEQRKDLKDNYLEEKNFDVSNSSSNHDDQNETTKEHEEGGGVKPDHVNFNAKQDVIDRNTCAFQSPKNPSMEEKQFPYECNLQQMNNKAEDNIHTSHSEISSKSSTDSYEKHEFREDGSLESKPTNIIHDQSKLTNDDNQTASHMANATTLPSSITNIMIRNSQNNKDIESNAKELHHEDNLKLPSTSVSQEKLSSDEGSQSMQSVISNAGIGRENHPNSQSLLNNPALNKVDQQSHANIAISTTVDDTNINGSSQTISNRMISTANSKLQHQFGLYRMARMPNVSSHAVNSEMNTPIGSPQVSYAALQSSNAHRLVGPSSRMSMTYSQVGNPPVALGCMGAQIGQPRVGYPQGNQGHLVGLPPTVPVSMQQQYHPSHISRSNNDSPIGMPRTALQPIGQPQLLHNNLKNDMPDSSNMMPIGNPPVIMPSGGMGYGQPPTSGILRVSQVGLPHQIPVGGSANAASHISNIPPQLSSLNAGKGKSLFGQPPVTSSSLNDARRNSEGNFAVEVKRENSNATCQLAKKQDDKGNKKIEELALGLASAVKDSLVQSSQLKDSSSQMNMTLNTAVAEVKEELVEDQKTNAEFKRHLKDDMMDPVPQNALLKQLLQNNQPQKKSNEEKEPDPDEHVTLTPDQQKQLELIDQMPLTQEVADNDHDPKEEKQLIQEIRKMQEIEEAQKGKRRQNQQKRQPKQPKSKDGLMAKKRPRKGSSTKPEEDYDSYMDSMMTQLKALPPLHIMEPDIPPSFNACPVYGSGTLNPGDCKLRGVFGNATILNHPDYYSVYPFGSNPPTPPASLPPTPPPQRGFYNQEFPNRQKDCKVNVAWSKILASSWRDSCFNKLRHSVEIPASLPTPPPQADRGQTPFRDCDSPDTIISSSSPECVYSDPPLPFYGLRLIKEKDDDSDDMTKSTSPIIPLVISVPIKVTAIRPKLEDKLRESRFLDDDDASKDKENIGRIDHRAETLLLKSKLGFGPPTPLKDSGNVAVTLTLTSAAAEDINRVLSAVADVLKIPVPPSYEIIERTATPPSQKLGLYKKGRETGVNIQTILNGKPRFCRHCDVVVLSAGIRKKTSELPFLTKDEKEEEEVIFCSTNCYMQFAVTHRTTVTEEKEAATVVDHISDVLGLVRSKSTEEIKSEKLQGSDVVSDNAIKTEEGTNDNKNEVDSTVLPEDHDESKLSSFHEDESGSELENKEVSVKLSLQESSKILEEPKVAVTKPKKHSSSEEPSAQEPAIKKWRGLRWKYWNIMLVPPKKYKHPSEEEVSKIASRLGICIRPAKLPEDSRTCVLCHDTGDGSTNGPARLLNMDVDKWIHLNCALWSAEVYETVNGALMNVESALKRSMTLECVSCRNKGATLGCFKIRCTNIYHFGCAIKEKCMFFKDKTMFCPLHVPKQPTPELRENELTSLAVFRRVYVNREETRQVACIMHQGDQKFLLRVGSLIFLSVGQLLPHQLQSFHTPNCIFPVGFKIIRMYWSMRMLGKRCQYICSIHDYEGKPEFRIVVKEPGQDEILLRDRTPKGVWQQVLEPIEKMRKDAKTIKVFSAFITGEDLFGLTEPSVLRVLESLPGIETLSDYNFKYGRSPLLELPLAINPTGCARSEPKLRTHFKKPHTLHTSSSSRSSFQTTITGLEVACPYTKQFVHSKSSQYRRMKTEWRNNVYLARSRIQGLGLYAARDLEKHTMVIEYIGQLIRNEVAETRERMYEAQNRGIYMFRLDDGRVIDATLCGGLARYINHSCNPNCVAEVVQIDRDNRIIIFANRRISRGEELTYDYKFDIEDDQHKIPCLCGAGNCRKWMN